MKNIFLLLSLFVVFTACTQGKYMTYDDYHDINMGQEISDIQVQMGRPYEVKDLSRTKQEYMYIERITIGDNREMFRKYILTVEDGKVIDKRVKEESTPAVQLYA